MKGRNMKAWNPLDLYHIDAWHPDNSVLFPHDRHGTPINHERFLIGWFLFVVGLVLLGSFL